MLIHGKQSSASMLLFIVVILRLFVVKSEELYGASAHWRPYDNSHRSVGLMLHRLFLCVKNTITFNCYFF